ncbi:MAG: hypothetical protein JWO20_3237 [Candidatus Angelobacter sp.]|nr:hypothetical protein [Candidatus Angelobacter sp.]
MEFDDRFPAASSSENYPRMLSPTAVGGSGGLFPRDKFLYEIKHVNFLVSVTVGIFGGVLLMLLGAGIAIKNKPSRLE